jgi:hypothetical protein
MHRAAARGNPQPLACFFSFRGLGAALAEAVKKSKLVAFADA